MSSLNTQPPGFGPTHPLYPQLLQLLRVTGATVPGPSGYGSSSFLGPVLYIATTQQMQPATVIPRDREPCLVVDVNGLGLSPGYYLGRLATSYTSLPVYEVGFGAGGPVTLPGLTAAQLSSLTINLSPVQIATLNNLNACQIQTFISLTVPQEQILTSSLTSTQISNLVGFLTPAQLQSLVTNLNVTQLQLLTTVYNPAQIQQLLLLYTPSQISTLISTLTTPQLQSLTLSIGRTPVNDTNYTCTTADKLIAYTAITAPRVVTLPLASKMPNGATIRIQDESGNASLTNTISFARTGTDTIENSTSNVVGPNTSYGGGEAETDGVSKWTVRKYPATGSGTTGTNGQSALGAQYSLTNTYAATGLSVSLPSAGTYLINCQVTGIFTTAGPPAGASGVIMAELFNATTSAVITGTPVTVCDLTDPTLTGQSQGTATISTIYTVTGPTTVSLYAKYVTASNNGSVIDNGTSAGGTVMNYVQLA